MTTTKKLKKREQRVRFNKGAALQATAKTEGETATLDTLRWTQRVLRGGRLSNTSTDVTGGVG